MWLRIRVSWSARSVQDLQRCLAKHLLVRGGEPAETCLLCIVVFVDDESDSIATRGLWAIASKVVLLCSAAMVDITIGSSGDTACMQGSA